MNDGQVLAKENFPEGKLVFRPNLSFRESLVMLKGRATVLRARYRPTYFLQRSVNFSFT